MLLFVAMCPLAAMAQVPPVLVKIAWCESRGHQTTPNGDLLVGVNGQDLGLYQINAPTWYKKSKELGYNIFFREDNEKMALWIYANYGTKPWNASSKCWKS